MTEVQCFEGDGDERVPEVNLECDKVDTGVYGEHTDFINLTWGLFGHVDATVSTREVLRNTGHRVCMVVDDEDRLLKKTLRIRTVERRDIVDALGNTIHVGIRIIGDR